MLSCRQNIDKLIGIYSCVVSIIMQEMDVLLLLMENIKEIPRKHDHSQRPQGLQLQLLPPLHQYVMPNKNL